MQEAQKGGDAYTSPEDRAQLQKELAMIRFFSISLLVSIFLSVFGNCALAGQLDNLTRKEKVVAVTLLAEARGEGSVGMQAVACVIQQRVVESDMGATAVCLQKKQFSCWNGGVSLEVLSASVVKNTSKSVLNFAVTLAKMLVSNKKLDRRLVQFANHYCTTETNPNWAEGLKPVTTIGCHKFFRL